MLRIPILLLLLCSLAAGQTPDLEELKKQALAGVESRAKLTQEMVDSMFSFAELGFQEYETMRYLTGILEKNGFRIERGVAGIPTAWVATFGSGKPVIGLMSDVDCIPRASQKPGVAYRAPQIEGAPGHGEGHNSGNAVNIVAALAVKDLMVKYKLPGTLKIMPGVAEELLATKAFYVREGLLKGMDVMIFSHVDGRMKVDWGQPPTNSGLVSVQWTFEGKAAHSAGAPWRGRSALDAVELMNMAWNMRREHMRPQQRSHYVITNGGDQPNVVPSEATVWYYLRELDYKNIQEMYEAASSIAQSAASMTGTTVKRRVVGSAWPIHMNKALAETMHKNMQAIGMPQWSDADLTLAKALQKEIGAKEEGLNTTVSDLTGGGAVQGGGSDDIGDISWTLPTVSLRYPANIPGLPGHSWENAIAMATPIAHKGSLYGAKVQAATLVDLLRNPEIIKAAYEYFENVQTKEQKYIPLISATDKPAIELNKEKMERFLPELRKLYYDPAKYSTYLEQLGIKYPTIRAEGDPSKPSGASR